MIANWYYYLTLKGAWEIDRESEYSYKEPKAITNAKHESSKIDIAMSFLLGYPDYLIDFDYYALLTDTNRIFWSECRPRT